MGVMVEKEWAVMNFGGFCWLALVVVVVVTR